MLWSEKLRSQCQNLTLPVIGINWEKPRDPYSDFALGLCTNRIFVDLFVSSTDSKSINCTSSDVGRQLWLSRILQEMLLFGTRPSRRQKKNQQLFIKIIMVNTFSKVCMLAPSSYFTAENSECRLRDSLKRDVFFFLIRRVQTHVCISIQTNKKSVVPKWGKTLQLCFLLCVFHEGH